MPLNCVAYGCTNHNMKAEKHSFFRFPNNNPERRAKWVAACKRVNKDGSPWNPTSKHVYLYDEHFVGKKPSLDPLHPDYIPSVFVFRQQEDQAKKMRRYESVKKRASRALSSTIVDQEFAHLEDYPCNDEHPLNSSASIVNHDQQSSVLDISSVSGIDFEMSTMSETQYETIERLKKEVESLKSENSILKAQKEADEVTIKQLKEERDSAISALKEKEVHAISYNTLKSQPIRFVKYTGLSVDRFDTIFDSLVKHFPPKCKSYKLSYQDQMLMTLMKLKMNTWLNLADQFFCSVTTVNSFFWKWIDMISAKLSFLIKWPDHDANIRTLPHLFRQYYPRLTGIIDCTELFTARPKKLDARAKVYSNYKKHSKVKFLIACTPQGSISFLSKAYGGRISDVELVKESGFLSLSGHHPGDQILADRGFTLVDEFAVSSGVQLIIPSFTAGKSQLSAEEVETTRHIASIRIHIERVIGLVKNRFKILSSGPFPISLIKSMADEHNLEDLTNIDKIMQVCCILTNLGDSIVYKEVDEE